MGFGADAAAGAYPRLRWGSRTLEDLLPSLPEEGAEGLLREDGLLVEARWGGGGHRGAFCFGCPHS